MTNREAIAAILEREGYPSPSGVKTIYSDRPCLINTGELVNLARVYWQVSMSKHRTEAQSKALQAKARAVYGAVKKRADCPEWLTA